MSDENHEVDQDCDHADLAALSLRSAENFLASQEDAENNKNPQKATSVDKIPSALTADRYRAENEDKKTDTRLKQKFAYYFFWVLAIQLVVMNGVFVLVGIDILKFSDLALNLYMSGTLIEVFGIVLVMVKYLFSNKK